MEAVRPFAASAALAAACALVAAVAIAAPEAAPSIEAVAAEEAQAIHSVGVLRDVSRELGRLAAEVEGSGGGGAVEAYAKWLRSASERTGALARRWDSNRTYFARDFPREALLADRERLAYALEWLGGINRDLAAEAVGLGEALSARNEDFAATAPGDRVDAARAILARLARFAPAP